MNKYKFALMLVFIVVATISCKKKNSSKPSSEIVEDEFSIGENLTAIGQPELLVTSFNDLTYKSKLTMNGSLGSFEEVNVTIRLKQDSLIWVSASHLGFEVARALIAPDSIRILNRFQKQYIAADYKSISQKIGIQLGYPQLQSLLTGELLYKPTPEGEWYSSTDSMYIYQHRDHVGKLVGVLDKTSQRAHDMKLRLTASGDLLAVEHRDFRTVAENVFPVSSTLFLKSTNNETRNMGLSIQHQKIEAVEVGASYPFSIPGNYRRIRL